MQQKPFRHVDPDECIHPKEPILKNAVFIPYSAFQNRGLVYRIRVLKSRYCKRIMTKYYLVCIMTKNRENIHFLTLYKINNPVITYNL